MHWKGLPLHGSPFVLKNSLNKIFFRFIIKIMDKIFIFSTDNELIPELL